MNQLLRNYPNPPGQDDIARLREIEEDEKEEKRYEEIREERARRKLKKNRKNLKDTISKEDIAKFLMKQAKK